MGRQLLANGGTTDEWPPSMQRRTHTFQGRECAYLYGAATSAAGAARPPLLLLHPVGIGISGWFWQRFAACWAAHPRGGSAVVVPDLLGCGASAWPSSDLSSADEAAFAADGFDAADAASFALPGGYVAQCEALLDAVAARADAADATHPADGAPWAVVVQVSA